MAHLSGRHAKSSSCCWTRCCGRRLNRLTRADERSAAETDVWPRARDGSRSFRAIRMMRRQRLPTHVIFVSAVEAALAAKPVYAETLRRAVWTYVGAERNAEQLARPRDCVTHGARSRSAELAPESVSRALTGRVVLWCVETYSDGLVGDVGRRDRRPSADPGSCVADVEASDLVGGAASIETLN